MKSLKECVETLDWESMIEAATLEQDPQNMQGQAAQVTPAEPFLNSGIARCFIPDMHKEAIEYLSKAIVLNSNIHVNNNEAYYYRAYAFYLDGNYEKAIEDCFSITNQAPDIYKDELLGKIYYAMSKYEEAVENFSTAVKWWFKQNPPIPNPGLLDSYREACKKMNSV